MRKLENKSVDVSKYYIFKSNLFEMEKICIKKCHFVRKMFRILIKIGIEGSLCN